MNETLQKGIPCNSIWYALRFLGGEAITYGWNHMIAGFKPSCGKWTYIVMQWNLIYGEWVWYGISGHQLVHSMLFREHDSPKLRAWAHDGLVIRFILIWVLIFLYRGENRGNLHELTGNILARPLIISMVCFVAIYRCHASHRFVCGWLKVFGSMERVMAQSL